MHDDELLDLVDPDDTVIGQMLRSEIYRHSQTNFRVVNAFLRNTEGRIWIPRRTGRKRLFPYCLDMSVGGHVKSGESYDEAIAREALEEVRLNLETTRTRLLGRLTPSEHGVSAFMQVYEINWDRTPEFNDNDFCQYFWLSPPEALARISGGDPAKDDLLKLLEYFYMAGYRE